MMPPGGRNPAAGLEDLAIHGCAPHAAITTIGGLLARCSVTWIPQYLYYIESSASEVTETTSPVGREI